MPPVRVCRGNKGSKVEPPAAGLTNTLLKTNKTPSKLFEGEGDANCDTKTKRFELQTPAKPCEKVKCPLCGKRVSKGNLSVHRKVHQRWRTPTKCDICRKHFSYDNFARHMLTHYSFDKFALTHDKASGGDYPMVVRLKEPNQYKRKEPGPKLVVHFDWEEGDRDVAP